MRRGTWFAVAVAAAVGTVGCRGVPDAGGVDLTGAGGTFPYPLYRRWFADYAVRTGVRINYLSVGSDAGLRLLDSAKVEFAAVERNVTPAQLRSEACPRTAVPTVAGAIAVVYNLPDQGAALRFDADLLADIFLGRVRRWNDRAVAARNPGAALPDLPITVVHRAPGSGTSRSFAEFLASSTHWPRPRTTDTDVSWAAGLQVEGNEGVSAQVQQTVGALGYVELAYANLYRLQVGLVQNALGQDILPSDASIRDAVSALPASVPPGTSLVLPRVPRSYPIASLTWLVLDPGTTDPERGARVVAFARWALREGARAADRLEYVPLPPHVVAHYDSVLTALRFGPCEKHESPGR